MLERLFFLKYLHIIKAVNIEKEVLIMKKMWENPAVEELNIEATADGTNASEEFDGPWVQIDGKNYRPGSNETTSLS